MISQPGVPGLLYRAITNGRSPATEIASAAARLAELERAHGGGAAAARAVGVSLRTWQRWRVAAAGTASAARERQRPSKASELRLTQAVRRARLKPGREARLRRSRVLRVTGEYVVSSDRRQRSEDIGPHVGALRGKILDAYLAGDNREMARLFTRALDEYIDGLEVHITKIEFE